MPAVQFDDPVLVRFRQALGVAYGNKLERVVLFGSRARGDARPDSDCDVAVFIHEPGSFNDEAVRLAAIGTDILMTPARSSIRCTFVLAPISSGRDSWPRSGAMGLICEAGDRGLSRQGTAGFERRPLLGRATASAARGCSILGAPLPTRRTM
jgi:predicted nucleotidyltransferase